MSNYSKYIIFFVATSIIVISLVFTNQLTKRLTSEETNKIEIWTQAMRQFNTILPEDTVNFEFVWKIIESNTNIPVIIAGSDNDVISHVNIGKIKKDTSNYLQNLIVEFKKENKPIELKISDNQTQFIYYDKSLLLKKLEIYPYIQLSIITLFLIIFFWIFDYEKRVEQNRVWVGLSKETAHQLGTPISSLMAWQEVLIQQRVEGNILGEINKDIDRLRTIAERFSKVGSVPVLQKENICDIVENAVEYLKNRTSSKVHFVIKTDRKDIFASVNGSLFDWVIENICKNAIDAMSGRGTITFEVEQLRKNIIIDITDTGKGIDKKILKQIFKPGFTTKQRGWGLGLSLAKRIVETYHKGKIFVKRSEAGVGSTFRIILNNF